MKIYQLLLLAPLVAACGHPASTVSAATSTTSPQAAAPPPSIAREMTELAGLGIQDSAIYFRDAYGRCLRMQLRLRVAPGVSNLSGRQPEQVGHLDIFEARNETCAMRERVGVKGMKE